MDADYANAEVEQAIYATGNRVATWWGPVAIDEQTDWPQGQYVVEVRHNMHTTKLANVDVWYNADYGSDDDTVRQLVRVPVTITGPDTIKLHFAEHMIVHSKQYCVGITAVLG